jgi:hypothetical protein
LNERKAFREFEDERERMSADPSKTTSDLKPQIFNYVVAKENGLEMERTNVVSLDKHINLTTYYRDGQNWSCLDVYHATPEGVYRVDFLMDPGRVYDVANTFVTVQFYSNELLMENGIDMSKSHPFSVYGKNITPLTLTHTNVGFLSRQQMEQFMSQIPQISMKDFYEQLEAQEKAKKEQEQQEENETTISL